MKSKSISGIVEKYEADLKSPHSTVGLMLNSVLAFPSKGETAGSMKEKLVPHLKKDFASRLTSLLEEIEGEIDAEMKLEPNLEIATGEAHALNIIRKYK